MYSIGDVARRAGLATSAIRYYESEGLIPPAERVGGRRVYDASIFERLGVIDLAKRSGFSVAEIKRLVRGIDRDTPPGPRWRSLATAKLEELEARIEEAQRMRDLLRLVMRCECPSFSDCAGLLYDADA